MKHVGAVLFACVVSGCAVIEDYGQGNSPGPIHEPRPAPVAVKTPIEQLREDFKDPISVTANRDRTLYLRADRDLDQVTMIRVINDGRNNVERTIPVGREPISIVLNRAESRAYVANLGDGTISILDVSRLDDVTVVDSIKIASNLFCLTFSRQGEFLYVVSRLGDKVWVVDPAVNQVTSTTSIRQLDLGVKQDCYSGCHTLDTQRRRLFDQMSKDLVAQKK